jgi:hypothetical protein
MTGCVDFVPYGYKPSGAGSSVYVPGNSVFTYFDITFDVPEDGCQIWEYKGVG